MKSNNVMLQCMLKHNLVLQTTHKVHGMIMLYIHLHIYLINLWNIRTNNIFTLDKSQQNYTETGGEKSVNYDLH